MRSADLRITREDDFSDRSRLVMGRARSTAHVLLGAAIALACDRSSCGPRREAPGTGGTSLGGTDCSDGLVRCVEGRVEASRLAHLPHPCGSMKEGRNECVCPWDTVRICASGCAVEGLVAIADPDAGSQQLCRVEPAALGAIVRPPLPGDPAFLAPRICNDVRLACIEGAVRSCTGAGSPEQVLAVCLHGCDPGIAIDHGESVIDDGAAAILCRRAHAERR